MSDPPTSPVAANKPGFTTLCRSLHDLLAAGKYREVWSTTNDILTRAVKLIDPITADFLRDDDDETAFAFLLFHEYLLYSITAPGWALILASDSPGEIAAHVFILFSGAQKISNGLCRTVLANAKGRVSLVERTWKIRGMLLEETRAAVEALWKVDTEVVARSARSPFGREAAMEPWSVLEALVSGKGLLGSERSVEGLLRGLTEPAGGGGGTGETDVVTEVEVGQDEPVAAA